MGARCRIAGSPLVFAALVCVLLTGFDWPATPPGVLQSSTTFQGETWSTSTDVVMGDSGVAFVAGALSSDGSFSNGLEEFDIRDVDSNGDFIAAIPSSGLPEWVVVTRGVERDVGSARFYSIAMGRDGFLYGAGIVYGDVVFDGPHDDFVRSTKGDASTATSYSALFIIKMAQDGRVLALVEHERIGGFGDVQLLDLDVDDSGAVTLAGWASGEIRFSGMGNSEVFTPVGRDGFVVNFEPSGQVAWLARISGDAEIRSLAMSSDGGIFAAGDFRGHATISDATANQVRLVATASTPLVVAIDSSGVLQWVSTSAGGGHASVEAVVVDPRGLFLLGAFTHTLTFRSASGVDLGLRGRGSREIFLARMDLSGSWLWANSIGGRGSDGAGGMTTSEDGRLAVVGTVYGPARVNGVAGSMTLDRGAGTGLVIASYDEEGNLLGATQDVAGSSAANGVAVSGDSMVVVGSVAGAVKLGANPPVSSSGSARVPQALVLRLSSASATSPPGKVLRLSVKRVGAKAVISWRPPASDGGLPILRYEFQVGRGAWNAVNSPRVEVALPKPGRSVNVGVRAVNAMGPGEAAIVGVLGKAP